MLSASPSARAHVPGTGASAPASAGAPLHLLAELSQAFARSLNLDETLALALRHITAWADAEAASVFLLENPDELLCRAAVGPVPIQGLRIPAGKGIIGRAIETRRSQLVRDVRADPDFNANVDRRTGFSTRSIMCTPLMVGNTVLGALQVLNKRSGDGLFNPQDRDFLRALGAATALAVQQAQTLVDVMQQKRIHQELDLARQMQRRLLPPAHPAPFPLLGANIPAREVSGDFYDYYPLPDGRIGFCLGDVSGKGVNAALMTVHVMSRLSGLGRAGIPLAEMMERSNLELCDRRFQGMFVCVFAGIFDPVSGQLEWCNAGLPPALLLRPDGVIEELGALTPPMGVVGELEFPTRQLALGDGRLLCYSDGVTESRNEHGAELEMAGLKALLSELQVLPADECLAALLARLRSRELRDDTTLLLLGQRQAAQTLVNLNLPCTSERLCEIRRAVDTTALDAGFSAERRAELVLAVDEAAANVVRHAYKGEGGGTITLRIERLGERLRFMLQDEGEPVDPSLFKPLKLDESRVGGLGLHLIDTIMDTWDLRAPEDGRGNLLVMSRRIE